MNTGMSEFTMGMITAFICVAIVISALAIGFEAGQKACPKCKTVAEVNK